VLKGYLIAQVAGWIVLYSFLFYRQVEGVGTKREVPIAWLCVAQVAAAAFLLEQLP
jgi:hypothetical protein